MPSSNVDPKRSAARDAEIPAELDKREAQDRAKGATGKGRAKSPVDSMHANAPNRQDNARGHRQRKRP